MKEKDVKETSFIIMTLSFMALLFNVLEQGLRLFSNASILPNLFISYGNINISKLAALLALIFSGIGLIIAGIGHKPIDSRGWILRRKNYANDWVLSHTKFFLLFSIVLLILINAHINTGLTLLSTTESIPKLINLQISSYVLFWALLSYVSIIYLKEYQDIKRFQEMRVHYPIILQDTIDKHNLILGDQRLKVLSIYQHYGYNLNLVESGEKKYIVVTSYDGIQIVYTKELTNQEFSIIKQNLEKALGIENFTTISSNKGVGVKARGVESVES
jgi:hypothetical protein